MLSICRNPRSYRFGGDCMPQENDACSRCEWINYDPKYPPGTDPAAPETDGESYTGESGPGYYIV